MSLERMRAGELLAAGSGAALAVFVFALPWFGAAGSGFARMTVLRWPLLATAASALALGYLQASRPAPALPVTASVVTSWMGLIVTVWLAIRILTGLGDARAGAWLGLAACAGVLAGGLRSMRQEDGWVPGPEHPIETVSIRTRKS